MIRWYNLASTQCSYAAMPPYRFKSCTNAASTKEVTDLIWSSGRLEAQKEIHCFFSVAQAPANVEYCGEERRARKVSVVVLEN